MTGRDGKQDSRGSASAERADYGFDAPNVPIFLGLGGLAALLVAVISGLEGWGVVPTAWWVLVGLATLASAGLYIYATRRGKHLAWARILDSVAWRGDETILDLGCGRGAVLMAAARRLPRGRAFGIDVWDTRDQSGNSLKTARRNAESEGVADRVLLQTADVRDLPFDDESFDAVLSSLVLHNIHSPAERDRALAGAVRVLRPGGRLLLADIMHAPEYQRVLRQLGLEGLGVRDLGPGTWYGSPFLRLRLVSGFKPARS